MLAAVGAIWVTWRTLRSTRSPSTKAGALGDEGPPTDVVPAPLHRANVEVLCAALRHREKPLFGLAIGCLLVATPFVLAVVFPDLDTRLVIYVEAPVALVALLGWQRRHERLVQEIGLVCPKCGAGQSETLLYVGRCASCRAQLLASTDLRPMPRPLVAEGSPLRNLVGLLLLLALIAWSIYQISRVIPRP